ncbi:MAG: ABC transporter ATP-binding protein [Planctomycetia bacterium]|nr:ABC transporter ATP-binding protein [Planctomycetia bacterium]
MPELLEPADPRGGSGALSVAPPVERALQTEPRPAARVPATAPLEPPLVFERVSKWYGPVIGVNQVTLELRPGVMTGLVGSNGAGKSTLMRLATGQLKPSLGRVRIRGLDAWSAEAKRHVGYCPDVDSFYEEMSGRQFVEAMARLCGYDRGAAVRRAGAALEQVGMAGRAERRLRGYSKGMRQRIKLAQALLHDPELLILDEPLSGIDPIGRQEFVALFRHLVERGKCLLISSHELEELEKLTDHVAIMARGRIAAVGSVAQIRELLDDHPHSILIVSDQPRELAGMLLRLSDVIGVELAEDNRLVVQAKNPKRFFAEFTRLVLEENFQVEHLETLDDSTHAVLGYLLGGGGR